MEGVSHPVFFHLSHVHVILDGFVEMFVNFVTVLMLNWRHIRLNQFVFPNFLIAFTHGVEFMWIIERVHYLIECAICVLSSAVP